MKYGRRKMNIRKNSTFWMSGINALYIKCSNIYNEVDIISSFKDGKNKTSNSRVVK